MAAEARFVPAPRWAMLVADGDTFVMESDDATFGDCHSKDVACQIAQHGLGAVAPGCAMDDPGLSPGRLGQDEIGPAFGQRSSHLGPPEDGEWPGRDQEVVGGGMSTATVIGHAATGDEAMDMRMVDELLRPSVQHRHHADGAADEVEETEILDKDGNSTGQFRRKATGKGGLKGYLKWAAVHR